MKKKDDFSSQFDHALDRLRNDSPENLSGFEREVWAEIALRDERFFSRLKRWFSEGVPTVSTITATGVAAVTVFLGVALAFSQANAYGKEVSHSMEERYVSSIHSILRSESSADENIPPQ